MKDLLGDRGAVKKAKAIEAADRLRQMRLVKSRVKGRLRMLTPLRESARLDVDLHPPDRDRLLDRFLKLAKAGKLVATKDWPRVREAVQAESGNLDSICDLAFRTGTRLDRIISALVGTANLSDFTGLGSVHTLFRSASNSRIRAQPELIAQVCLSIGRVALARSDHATARQRLEEALPLSMRPEISLARHIAICRWAPSRSTSPTLKRRSRVTQKPYHFTVRPEA